MNDDKVILLMLWVCCLVLSLSSLIEIRLEKLEGRLPDRFHWVSLIATGLTTILLSYFIIRKP